MESEESLEGGLVLVMSRSITRGECVDLIPRNSMIFVSSGPCVVLSERRVGNDILVFEHKRVGLKIRRLSFELKNAFGMQERLYVRQIRG